MSESIDGLDLSNDPTVRKSFQTLFQKVEYLEKEVYRLKELLNSKPPDLVKKSLVDSLPTPSISFDKWAEQTLLLVEDKLEVVFQNDLLKGINSVITDSVNESGELPIAVFNRKPHNYYYYQDDCWKPLELSELNHFIGRIAYRFLVEFKRCWYVPNIDNINQHEDYKTMYNSYYMNILGGTRMTDESRNQRVRHNLYTLIKQ
jgi:hypothetical protein